VPVDAGKVGPQARNIFKFKDGESVSNVHQSRTEIAREIDKSRDGFLSDDEIKGYLRKKDILRDPNLYQVDDKQILKDYKTTLKDEPLPQADGYRSYDQMVADMKALESKYPDLARTVVLGKTAEGREIVGLKLSKGAGGDTSKKTGVVFTGCHHAREWNSAEQPLFMAEKMLSAYASDPKMQQRFEKGEIWAIPVANPDGYTYSREKDTWWRKSRRPITDDGCGTGVEGGVCPTGAEPERNGEGPSGTGSSKAKGVGVDLNRNYWDGKQEHFELYRPPGDKPCNTWDDFSATSDDPGDDTYRGPSGGSEAEVKALMDLELGHKNIKGVIDHHSYGRLILYPWGHTYDPAENIEEYKIVGEGMKKGMGLSYTVKQSANLYPTSGSSEDMQHVNGIMSYTIEMGRSFQPQVGDMQKEREEVYKANLYFLDYILENKKVEF
jgi:carboxypeptidase T